MTVPNPDAEWWNVNDCAKWCNDIHPGTWRCYVTIGLAPKADDPDSDRPPNRRAPRWRPSTVINWHSSRPGHGGRPPTREKTA